MIKKIIAVLTCTLLFAPMAKADREEIVRLDNRSNKTQTIDLDYATVKFQVLSFHEDAVEVSITVDNMTPAQTVIMFKKSHDERRLRKRKPKITFVETYGGDRGHRSVSGCKHLRDNQLLISPSSDKELFQLDVSTRQPTNLVIPFYVAKYIPKKLFRQARYSILREDIIKFAIEIKGWSEDDPQFVSVKKAVTEFLQSLTEGMFCNSERHNPPLHKQQLPYIQRRDSLIDVIDNIILTNSRWMSDHTPHIMYSALKARLNEIDLDKYAADCGAHKKINSHGYCSFCSLNAKQLFERLDDTYQQLHTGMIDKQNAVKTAKALYNCYRQSSYRKKDRLFGEKITDYYNRIINF